MNKPVVMGRKTFVSIGTPAARPHQYRGDARSQFSQLPARWSRIRLKPPARSRWATRCGVSATEIAVIGGGEIYAQWMDVADRLEITEVHASPAGDAHFAAIDPATWEEVSRVRNPAGEGDSAAFSYVTYRRRGAR